MSWCPYIHNDECNRGCRGFECRHREENRPVYVHARDFKFCPRCGVERKAVTCLCGFVFQGRYTTPN